MATITSQLIKCPNCLEGMAEDIGTTKVGSRQAMSFETGATGAGHRLPL